MNRRLSLIVGVLPSSRLKNALLNLLGHTVASSASIGPVLIFGNTRISADEMSKVGPLNVFRNVTLVKLGAHSEMGQFNWISAAPFLIEESTSSVAGEFHLGTHSSFTSRHYVDASGGVIIDEFVTIAGVRSVFMSHGIDVNDSVLDSFPIHVEKYAMVGGCTNFVMGSVVPAYSVVAMGSVVIKGLDVQNGLYAGTPAKYKKAVPMGEYSRRTVGAVPPRSKESLLH